MVTVVCIGVLAITAVISSAFAQPNLHEISSFKETLSGVQGGKQPASNPNITTPPDNAPGVRLSALEVASGYTVNQIPYGSGRFAWVDNNSILFAGAPHPNESEVRRPQIALYQWRLVTGTVTKISDLGEGPDICYDRGHLYVAFNRGNERVIRQGPINQLQEIVVTRKESSPLPGNFNRYDCKFRQTPQATRTRRHVAVVLREDHGFIEMEYGASVDPARLYFLVPPKAEPIPIDLRCGGRGPRYVDFVPGYVFQEARSFSDHRVGPLVCVVGVNGTVSTYQLPVGDWLRATVYGVPVRSGMLIVSLATQAKADGAYVARGESVEKVISGYINQFVVSPDGCKVAVSISPKHGLPARHAVLNVCKGGG